VSRCEQNIRSGAGWHGGRGSAGSALSRSPAVVTWAAVPAHVLNELVGVADVVSFVESLMSRSFLERRAGIHGCLPSGRSSFPVWWPASAPTATGWVPGSGLACGSGVRVVIDVES
jgi:hypothetical protein